MRREPRRDHRLDRVAVVAAADGAERDPEQHDERRAPVLPRDRRRRRRRRRVGRAVGARLERAGGRPVAPAERRLGAREHRQVAAGEERAVEAGEVGEVGGGHVDEARLDRRPLRHHLVEDGDALRRLVDLRARLDPHLVPRDRLAVPLRLEQVDAEDVVRRPLLVAERRRRLRRHRLRREEAEVGPVAPAERVRRARAHAVLGGGREAAHVEARRVGRERVRRVRELELAAEEGEAVVEGRRELDEHLVRLPRLHRKVVGDQLARRVGRARHVVRVRRQRRRDAALDRALAERRRAHARGMCDAPSALHADTLST